MSEEDRLDGGEDWDRKRGWTPSPRLEERRRQSWSYTPTPVYSESVCRPSPEPCRLACCPSELPLPSSCSLLSVEWSILQRPCILTLILFCSHILPLCVCLLACRGRRRWLALLHFSHPLGHPRREMTTVVSPPQKRSRQESKIKAIFCGWASERRSPS